MTAHAQVVPLMFGSTVDDAVAGVGLTAIGGVLVFYWAALARGAAARRRTLQRAHRRAGQAHAAAVEASLEKGWFAPEDLSRTVDELIGIAVGVWSESQARPAARKDGPIVERWARSVGLAGGAPPLRLIGRPSVDVLRVVSRPGEAEDRVVLRVRPKLRSTHRGFGHFGSWRPDLRWTLGRADGEWRLLSIGGDPLAGPVLEGRLIPTDWADDDRLREASLVELAGADRVDPRTDLSQLISADAPASRQLIELAQIDSRFDPNLIETRIAHIVEAWEAACTGSVEPLAAVALPEAIQVLLHPPSGQRRNRLVLRDAVTRRWEATRLAVSTGSIQVEIALTVTAARYLLIGGEMVGSPAGRHDISLVWTLALADPDSTQWQLAASTSPSREIPGGG